MPYLDACEEMKKGYHIDDSVLTIMIHPMRLTKNLMEQC